MHLPRIQVRILALPIGNFDDLSFRGKRALESAKVIFCEDSRKLQLLLKEHGVRSEAQWIAIPGDEEWNFDYAALRKAMKDDDLWVLVSDAGSPGINDPGRALVEFAEKNSVEVHALPGPSAVTGALQWGGGFGLPFSFLGFAPKAKPSSAKEWQSFFAPAGMAATLIFFDTRHQIENTLQALIDLGHAKQELYLVREMTKPHEELIRGDVEGVLALVSKKLKDEGVLGELTVVLRGWPQKQTAAVSLETLSRLRKAHVKEASKIAAELTGLPSRECYKIFAEGDS